MVDRVKEPGEPKLAETKQIIEKFIKEKPEKLEHKEKVEKLEFKEKPEKVEHKEKPEKHEHKEKPEKFEHKEKPEKFEHKEKLEFLEKLPRLEGPEKPIVENNPKDIAEGITQGLPGGPVELRVAALEQAVASMQHFISSSQRPDLSRGALAAERDVKKPG